MVENTPLGIIAGGGDLPRQLIQAVRAQGRDVFVIAYEGETDEDLLTDDIPHAWIGMGAVNKTLKLLKGAGVQELVLVGKIKRPSFGKLRLDFGGVGLVKRILQNGKGGDNALFRVITEYLEEKGLTVVGVKESAPELLAPHGVLGKVKAKKAMWEDIERGVTVVRVIGEQDIGQAVVVQHGLVLGVEAVEGTDALIERCGIIRKEKEGGVLVKIRKPNQDSRVDLPTIGVDTVNNIYNAGLGGIAVEAGGAIILDRESVIARANELGIVLVGV